MATNSMERPDTVLWYMIAGTRGGPTRFLLLHLLCEGPLNANQLSEASALDYKTVIHHLEILLRNGIVYVSSDGGYGKQYSISSHVKDVISNLGKG